MIKKAFFFKILNEFKKLLCEGHKALNNNIYNKVPVFATISLSTLVIRITSKNIQFCRVMRKLLPLRTSEKLGAQS